MRNRGRLRDPYDSPLRDGNRDRLFGLLTQRAAASLLVYLVETNQNLAKWLQAFLHEHPIPRSGRPEELSGDLMLQTLLCLPEERIENPYTGESLTIDPRSLAQRILDVRSALAVEWVQDLAHVKAENADMLRQSLTLSLGAIATTDEELDDDGRPRLKE